MNKIEITDFNNIDIEELKKYEIIHISDLNIKKIDKYFFRDFHNLKEIIIDKENIIIDEFAFCNSFNLEKVSLNNPLIKDNAFYNTKVKVSVLLSYCNFDDKLPNYLFSNRKDLKDISLKNNFKTIKKEMFSNSDIENVNFLKPHLIKKIERAAFFCSKIKRVQKFENLEKIEKFAFSGTDIKEFYFNKNLKEIDDYAFSDCKNLERVIIKKGVKRLGDSCFSNCINLKEVIIESDILEIGSFCFKNCINLENIKINSKIEKIGLNAFLDTKIDKNKLLFDLNKTKKFKDEIIKSLFSKENMEFYVVPSNIKKIGSKAFYECSNLKDIVFNEKLEKIGDFCFSKTSLNLESLQQKIVNIKAFSKKLPNTMFALKDDLINFKVNENIEDIGDFTFYLDKNLENVILPNNLKRIGKFSFSFCESLKSISLPKSVRKIDERAFYNCFSLEKIDLSNVLYIEKASFKNCKNLKEIKLSNMIKNIKESTFENCESLEEIYIPLSVRKIGERAFKNCKKLKKVYCSKYISNYFLDENVQVTIIN